MATGERTVHIDGYSADSAYLHQDDIDWLLHTAEFDADDAGDSPAQRVAEYISELERVARDHEDYVRDTEIARDSGPAYLAALDERVQDAERESRLAGCTRDAQLQAVKDAVLRVLQDVHREAQELLGDA